MKPFRICFVASEVAPFAKTGGLGDVCAALPVALRELGHDVRVFVPLYAQIEQRWPRADAAQSNRAARREGNERGMLFALDTAQRVRVQMGGRTLEFTLYTLDREASGDGLYFVHCPELYERPGIYTNDPDEHLRFLLLCHAALQGCQRLRFSPDVVHCHDWQTAMLAVYVKSLYAWDRLFHATKTVLTLHNLGYQGIFESSVIPETGLYQLAPRVFDEADLRARQLNFLKTGILHADALTTVSPTYAKEIQTEAFGYGLHPLLARRADALTGILNGVDTREWNPRTDRHLAFRYSQKSLWRKERNKEMLLSKLSMRYQRGVPLVGIVSRLAGQKGFDLLRNVLPDLLSGRDQQLVVLGSGEERYERFFSSLQLEFPGQVSFYRGFNEDLAHWIEAGADAFVMPSRYEPCGLNQMYSLLYGTVPVVRRTGGLADTVQLWDPAAQRGNGIVFDHFTEDGLRWGLNAALDLYAAHAQGSDGSWRAMQLSGMGQDFSWRRGAQSYADLYTELCRPGRTTG